MAPIGNRLLVRRLVTTALYKCCRLIFTCVQRVYWTLNGTAAKIRESRDPKNYDRCCQVLDIRYVHKFCAAGSTYTSDFVCTHSRFESPQYIIDNDHISLMTIDVDNDIAVFGEAPGKGMHVWRTEYSSFVRVAQYSHSKRLIYVPLDAFHRMSETIGDTKATIAFLFNVGRCGSTLFTQVMEYTGRCASLSEPNSPTVVALMYRKEGDTPRVRKLARDVIRWECRPYPSIQPPLLAYVLKVTAPSTVALAMFRELYPNAKYLFMYRDILKVAKSCYRLSLGLPSIRLAYILGSYSGTLAAHAIDQIGWSGRDLGMRFESELTFGILMSVVTMNAYLEMRRRGQRVAALRYEDLVSRPLETCRRLMEYCELPLSLAESAVEGLSVDSQRNTPVARTIIGHQAEPELTQSSRKSLNALLAKYNLPLIGEETILDGTLVTDRDDA